MRAGINVGREEKTALENGIYWEDTWATMWGNVDQQRCVSCLTTQDVFVDFVLIMDRDGRIEGFVMDRDKKKKKLNTLEQVTWKSCVAQYIQHNIDFPDLFWVEWACHSGWRLSLHIISPQKQVKQHVCKCQNKKKTNAGRWSYHSLFILYLNRKHSWFKITYLRLFHCLFPSLKNRHVLFDS